MASSTIDATAVSQGADAAQTPITQAHSGSHIAEQSGDIMLELLQKMSQLPQIDSPELRSLLSTYSSQLALNPQTVNDPDLSELWELEKSLPGGENGFKVLHTNISSKIDPNRQPVKTGTLHTRAPLISHRSHNRVLRTKNKHTEKINESLRGTYSMDDIEGLKKRNPRDALEALIMGPLQKDKRSKYLNITEGSDKAIRENLGIPPVTLEAGKLLLSTETHLLGIHAEYLYLSFGNTITEFHRQDGDLHSANILYEGFSKLWLFISPCSFVAFENLVCKLFEDDIEDYPYPCSQFVRHLNVIMAPSFLDEHDIKYTVYRQSVGDLVMVGSRAYHFVVNEGDNMAGAINYAPEHWGWPLFYKDCDTQEGCANCGVKKGCGADGLPHSTHFAFTGQTRPLDLSEKGKARVTTGAQDSGPKTQTPATKTDKRQNKRASNKAPETTATTTSSVAGKPPKTSKTPSRATTADIGTSSEAEKTKKKRARVQTLIQTDVKSVVVGSQVSVMPKRARVQSSTRTTTNLLSITVPDDELPLVLEEPEDRERALWITNLKALGSGWLEFYERESTQHTEFYCSLIYDVLTVIAALGCPSIIQNVAQVFEQNTSFPENLSKPEQVYAVYKHFVAEQHRLDMQTRLLQVYLARFMEKADRRLQEDRGLVVSSRPSTRGSTNTKQLAKIDANESSDDESESRDPESGFLAGYGAVLDKIRAERSDETKVKSATMVIDTVTELLSHKSPNEKEWKTERDHLTRAKESGALFIKICHLLFGKHASFGGVLMLPVGTVESPLDPRVGVTMNRIKRLVGDEIGRKLLFKATKELVLEIINMAVSANRIYEVFIWTDARKGNKRVEHAIKCMKSRDKEQYLACLEWTT